MTCADREATHAQIANSVFMKLRLLCYGFELLEMSSFAVLVSDNGSASAEAGGLNENRLPEISKLLTENARMQGVVKPSMVLPVMRMFFA